MNAERLHAVVNALRDDLSTTNAVKLIQQLTGALQNQINSPQETSHQTQVADYQTKLLTGLRTAPTNSFPPTWKQTMEEIGASGLFGLTLADRIEEIFSRNQITPSVARKEINEIGEQLKTFQNSLDQIRSGFSQLGVGAEKLEPGTAELGVLIPRDFVKNKLEEFAKELKELEGIFSVFSELATGSRPGFPIHSISSSDLSMFLGLSLPVAACLAVAVERIVGLYKQLLEIRKLHNELREQNVPEKNLKGIEEHANSFMDENIGAVVDLLVKEFYKNADGGRKNELKIELRQSLNKLANRIDRGFNVEVRVAPTPKKTAGDKDDENKKYEELIVSAAPTLQFLKREGKPILALRESLETKAKKKEE